MGTAQDYVLTMFMQQEMEREVLQAKFAAQMCMSLANPENTSAITELQNNWQKFVYLSYSLDPKDMPMALDEAAMRKEYDEIKDLRPSLQRGKDGTLQVVGLPVKKSDPKKP